ncbi:MAG TPA: hypothetical protein VGC45_15690 [Gryllotalpicola sp.]
MTTETPITNRELIAAARGRHELTGDTVLLTFAERVQQQDRAIHELTTELDDRDRRIAEQTADLAQLAAELRAQFQARTTDIDDRDRARGIAVQLEQELAHLEDHQSPKPESGSHGI